MNSTTQGPQRLTLRSILAGQDPGILAAEAERLNSVTREELDRHLFAATVTIDATAKAGKKFAPATRLRFWQLNVEYTRRGIPPAFRRLPDLNDDDADQIADMFAVDFRWLATRHPKHRTLFSRWSGLFKPSTFHGCADYVAANYPRREMHWFARGLDLLSDQQRELATIKRDHFRRELDGLKARREEIRVMLAARYHARAQDPRYRSDDPQATIARRGAIWFCGSLADWMPQRTTDLYEALTGEPMTRQRAAKIIEQVHRDIPESRPRRTRTRKRRAFSDDSSVYACLTNEVGV